jgi:small subunit ribosomal protein S6
MVILDPDLEERTVAPSLDQYLNNVVRKDGGTVEKVDVWGRRRLAYEVDKNAEGIYAVIELQAEPATVKELDRQLTLNESVLRTKVIRPITRMPRCSDSAAFSAACRHTEQFRNSASPSFHSLDCRSKVRGVDATVKFATAAPDGVKRSSGSAVRLPTTVMGVSPAMSGLQSWYLSMLSDESDRGNRSGDAMF